MKTNIHFWSYLAHFFLEWKMFQTKVVEKIKTHILCSVTFFRKPCHLRDNAEKNTVERGRSQMKIWRMRIACWIPKATNTHSEYVILISFPLQQWLHERASTLRYAYIARLVWRLTTSETIINDGWVKPEDTVVICCNSSTPGNSWRKLNKTTKTWFIEIYQVRFWMRSNCIQW